MEVEPDASAVIPDLVAALEQATLMAKQLQVAAAADPSQTSQVHAALHFAYHHLSQFFSQHPQFAPPPRGIHPENSVSSAVGGGREENGETAGGEPMQIGDDDEDEQNSRAPGATVEKVEEKMRDCFIQNKRPKRRLSPSAELRGRYDDEAIHGGGVLEAFDPIGTKLKSLELIYQFHA